MLKYLFVAIVAVSAAAALDKRDCATFDYDVHHKEQQTLSHLTQFSETLIRNMHDYYEEQIRLAVYGKKGDPNELRRLGLNARMPTKAISELTVHHVLHGNEVVEQLTKAQASMKQQEKFHLDWLPKNLLELKAKALQNCGFLEDFLIETVAVRYHKMRRALKAQKVITEYNFPEYVYVNDAVDGVQLKSYTEVVAAVEKIKDSNPNNEAKRLAAGHRMAELLGQIIDRINGRIAAAKQYVLPLYKKDQFKSTTQEAWDKLLADIEDTFNKDKVKAKFIVDLEGDFENDDDQQEPLTSVDTLFRAVLKELNDKANKVVEQFMFYQFVFLERPHGGIGGVVLAPIQFSSDLIGIIV